MKMVVPIVVVLLFVAVAVWFATSMREPGQTEKNPAPREVTWRGVITALVTDYVNKTSRVDFFLDFGNSSWVPLDLSNATYRLRDHLAVYVGNPDKPVYVRGLWDGKVLRAVEVYD